MNEEVRKAMSSIDWTKEWIKACRYALEDGTLTYQDYIKLLKGRIVELKKLT
jgi:hypothetical protein